MFLRNITASPSQERILALATGHPTAANTTALLSGFADETTDVLCEMKAIVFSNRWSS